MLIVFRAAVSICFFAALVGASLGADEQKFITPEELDKLPEGIKVVHEPKIALATHNTKSNARYKYTWWYKTTVSSDDSDVTIEQFGVLIQENGKWVNGGAYTGKPYATDEFADWYKCPKAVVKKGKSYSDPRNWSAYDDLRADKMRWYYVGIDSKGKKVKGQADVELKDEIDPKKPAVPK
jgi:hypothetical protein